MCFVPSTSKSVKFYNFQSKGRVKHMFVICLYTYIRMYVSSGVSVFSFRRRQTFTSNISMITIELVDRSPLGPFILREKFIHLSLCCVVQLTFSINK